MNIVEVTDKKQIKSFLAFPPRLYKDDPCYIRPLDKDIEAVFDPTANKLFRNGGQAKRWLLENSEGEVIGKVAAFFNPKTINKDNKQPTGGMGFFDCIDDQEAANLLFDTCKTWLQSEGMEAMDGPINFGDRDRWWGCLIDGFHEPNYCMHYNFPYYQKLYEGYGFNEYFKQYTYRRVIHDPLNPKVTAKAERIFKNPDYEFRHMKVKELEKYAEDFRTIYNLGWAKHGGVAKMPQRQAINTFKSMKPVIEESLVWFAYHKGEPTAFFIMLPELNQWFKHLNGKFDWLAKLKFLYHKKFGNNKKCFGVVFGVVPAHQGKGVEAAISVAYRDFSFKPSHPFRILEMNWIGDFNPSMMRVAEDVGGSIYKTHATFRKLFDPNVEFERMKTIGR